MDSPCVCSPTGCRPVYALIALILLSIPVVAQVNSNACLDATNGYVVVPHAPPLNLSPALTIEAWVKPAPPSNAFGAIVDKNYTSGFSFGVASLGASRTDSVDVVFKALGYSFPGARIASDSLTWVHIAATVDTVAHQLVFYLNGSEVRTVSNTHVRALNNSTDLRIGRSYYGDQFRGMCDEVRIWNVIRTSSDIAALWDQEAKGNEAGLVAVYHFEDVRDTIAWNRASVGGLSGSLSARDIITLMERPDAYVTEDETNNKFASATPMGYGSIITTATIAPADTDCYKFWTWPGDAIVIRASAKTLGDSCDLRASFYGPDTVFHITTYVGGYPSFYTAASVPGYHYIRVTNISGAGGAYVLRVYLTGETFAADEYEPNNSKAQATPWTWGTTGLGTIFPGLDAGVSPPDTDYYSVTAQKDEIGVFVYSYEGYPHGSGFCTVHDATNQLAKTYSTYHQNLRFPAAGTYYIRVRPNEATYRYYWGAFKGLADIHEMLYAPVTVGSGAVLTNGMNNSYYHAYQLRINNSQFNGSPNYALTDLEGRQYFFGPMTMSGLTVTRKFFVPSATQGDTLGYMRIQDILANPTGAPITITVGVNTSLPQSSTKIIGSSSGDTLFTKDDRWLWTDDNSPMTGKPNLLHIIDGVGGADRVDSAMLGTSSLYWEWRNVTVPPGETKIYLYFVSQDSLPVNAQKKGPAFSGTSLPAGAKLGLGSDANRVMNWPTDALVSVEEQQTAPKVFALEQNFPNPFNPKTVVSCQLPVASRMRLVVYDLLGREVAVLMDEEKLPGAYSITFDASILSSGVYFYRLTAGEFVATRKMLLLR